MLILCTQLLHSKQHGGCPVGPGLTHGHPRRCAVAGKKLRLEVCPSEGGLRSMYVHMYICTYCTEYSVHYGTGEASQMGTIPQVSSANTKGGVGVSARKRTDHYIYVALETGFLLSCVASFCDDKQDVQNLEIHAVD